MDQQQPVRISLYATVIACVLGFGFTAGLGTFWVQYRVRQATRGWNLVPVVVAAQDLPAGTVITFDMISQRSVPEQFVTTSIVRPESASQVVKEKLRVPLAAGDLLLWTSFETASGAAASKPAP